MSNKESKKKQNIYINVKKCKKYQKGKNFYQREGRKGKKSKFRGYVQKQSGRFLV